MELWKEIYATLRRNPLRTLLTAFGVSWGIFMLMLNLGLGQGLENGVQSLFKGFSTNNLFVWGQSTTIPYKGFTEGRRIQLELDDVDYITSRVEGIRIIAPRAQLGGYNSGNNVKYNDETGAFAVQGDIPDVRNVYQWVQVGGRFINETDLKESRKVCSIGVRVKEVLFKDADPIGEYISVNGVNFMVVGYHKSPTSGDQAERDEQQIIIPMSTYQKAFDGSNKINWIAVVCYDNFDAEVVEGQIKDVLRVKYSVHPDDPRGFGSFNAKKMFGPMQMTFITVRVMAWFVGVMTLFAGIIGVSNIMIVTVKERTKEIGVRRAIGAKPINIITQILAEALVLTFISGAIGLLSGIWFVEFMSSMEFDNQMFKNPEIEMSIAITALTILVISGCVAGFLPANRALRIKPVEALRYE